MKNKRNTQSREPYDVVIRAGHLLSMRGGRCAVKIDHCVAVRGSQIAVIEPWKKSGYRGKKIIDASKQLVMPGLINGHTHLSMSLFRGLADDLPFKDWLFKYILPLEARLVSPEFVRLGAELSLYEALLSGTTTLCDMYYFMADLAETVDASGMRVMLGQSIADFPMPDERGKKDRCFDIVDEIIDRFSDNDRVIPSLAPHAPYSCSDDTLKKALAYVQKKSIPLQIHVSETAEEVANSLKEFKETPVQRLSRLGILDYPSILAHCVHLGDADIDLVARSKAGVIHNPECNMKLGSGAAPVVKMLRAGLRVGLGTDGPASNNNLNLFGEMDVATKLQKFANSDNAAMTAEEALRMATFGSAQAIGLAEKIGSIEIGKFADIICLNLDGPHMQPVHSIPSHLVYSATGAEVDTVLCHGKVLLEGRKAKKVDAEDLYARIARYRKKNKF